MFGIGGWELLVIIAVALMVLGPRRLPDAARAVGRGVQQLRKATVDLRRSIELDPEMGDLPRTLDELGRPIISPGPYSSSIDRTRPKLDQRVDGRTPPSSPAAPPAGGGGGEAPAAVTPDAAAAGREPAPDAPRPVGAPEATGDDG